MTDNWMIFIRPVSSYQALQDTLDYKYYCFDGEPKFLYVSQGLEDHETASISFLDLDWSRMPFRRSDYKDFDILPHCPNCLIEMTELSRALAEGISFVRVDFFEYEERPRFSGMTFHPCSGFMRFEPDEWGNEVGEMVNLKHAYSKLS